MKQKDQILFFSWFPRTNLHLREIYSFLKDGSSDISQLKKSELKALHSVLKIKELHKGFKDIEYVKFTNTSDIEVKIYADGLVCLFKNTTTSDSQKDRESLKKYYEENLSRALIYIFSIGAPILYHKNIWDVSTPTFIIQKGVIKQEEDNLFSDKFISLNKIDEDDYLVIYKDVDINFVEDKVSEIAFLKILKDTIHTFLNVHRDIWNSIDTIYQKKNISGRELDEINKSLAQYQKTNNKIKRRLRSFNLYITRRLIINSSSKDIGDIKEYVDSKYGFLTDSLEYVIGLWDMTENYIKQTTSKVSNIRSKINSASIANITIIAIVGVGSSVISLLTKSAPKWNDINFLYLTILILIGYVGNYAIRAYYMRKVFKLEK